MSFFAAQFREVSEIEIPVAAAVVIDVNELVCVNAGYAVSGSSATGLKAIGPAVKAADNTSGAAGAKNVTVKLSRKMLIADYANDTAGGAVAAADLWVTPIYVKDARTITKTSTGRSLAGLPILINPNGTIAVLFNQY